MYVLTMKTVFKKSSFHWFNNISKKLKLIFMSNCMACYQLFLSMVIFQYQANNFYRLKISSPSNTKRMSGNLMTNFHICYKCRENLAWNLMQNYRLNSTKNSSKNIIFIVNFSVIYILLLQNFYLDLDFQ